MAKEELEEEYEDDEEDEEEEEFDLVDEIKRNIRSLMNERRKYKPMSEEYMILTQRIADETENLRNAEAGENERAQRISAEKNRYIGAATIVANVIGSFGGKLVESLMNRKNVKTVVCKEDEGDLPMRSGATKFLK